VKGVAVHVQGKLIPFYEIVVVLGNAGKDQDIVIVVCIETPKGKMKVNCFSEFTNDLKLHHRTDINVRHVVTATARGGTKGFVLG
jgi:hypothetical protein